MSLSLSTQRGSLAGPRYKRGAVMQAALALVGAGAGIARWGAGGGLGWLVSGVVLSAIVPFTLVVILPTNSRLLDASLDKASPEAEALLARWGRLHAVRSADRKSTRLNSSH